MTQQWEYKVVVYAQIPLQTKLDELGPQGWELIYLVPFGEPIPNHAELNHLYLVFKRPLNP